MTFSFGKTSTKRLIGVHPYLVECCLLSIEKSEVDFAVVAGVRTLEEQVRLYAKGRTTKQMRAAGIYDVEGQPNERVVTWTLNSNHFVRPSSGFGHAVDLAPWVGGKIVWEPWKLFRQIADVMLETAADLHIPLTWGGTWTQPDGPHFELPRDYDGEINGKSD